jgi:hypothetical protein
LENEAIRLVLQTEPNHNPPQANVSPLRQRMIDDMRWRQLSPKTQNIYLRIVREFARFPTHLSRFASGPQALGQTCAETHRREYALGMAHQIHRRTAMCVASNCLISSACISVALTSSMPLMKS